MFVLGDKFGLAWIVPLPFYFMEVLIALVQLVFMLLVAVYIGLICNHGDEEVINFTIVTMLDCGRSQPTVNKIQNSNDRNTRRRKRHFIG